MDGEAMELRLQIGKESIHGAFFSIFFLLWGKECITTGVN